MHSISSMTIRVNSINCISIYMLKINLFYRNMSN
ncbi:Hypothetical protein FNO222_1248 [Francisella orientalis]|uniref:Uncharacterized protein n=1 Tax=Francisella orientalis TaxID=299583 RepID=A0ABM5U6Q8_9GAMM|nr:hypothetical protein FNO12_1237 [Francisella orientalis FNO12]AKN87367.1 Hypothetical protein FNO24_1239 [Francisella orientalis FNO24]AKN88904.1 Hypothetical protein FNO190_1237 [Francisella orientalis]AKU05663.1 Hypothetical protein FNO01_1237 [Francisella orientalis]QEN20577.1 Hypothetical protein FNO39_1248 [Francisella orientalis]